MSELGSSAAVGIESVEWLDAGAGQLSVRVTGRWRRRRGWVESRASTVLVVEAEGRRHRFPATPEPPSLAGAAPGTWRLTFTVPAEFSQLLAGHVWLALGSVTVPLPVPESAPSGPAERAEESPPERAAPGSAAEEPSAPEDAPEPAPPPLARPAGDDPGPAGLEIERAWRRADAAERVAAELGGRLASLEAALERDRADRAAEAAAREPAAPRAEDERLRAEDALRLARRRADVRVPAEPPAPVVGMRSSNEGAPGRDPTSGPSWASETLGADALSALRRELHVRVAAEAGLRARAVQAETRLAARILLEQRTAAVLAELRGELARLGTALAEERARREGAEAEVIRLRARTRTAQDRSREAYAAIDELRGALGLRAAGPPRPPRPPREAFRAVLTEPAGERVTPDRLSDAFARLRESTEPRDPGPQDLAAAPAAPAAAELVPAAAPAPAPAAPEEPGAAGPTVEGAFRRIAVHDPAQAGRLLIGLLGAQGAAWPRAIAYDLELGPGRGTVQVTVGDGAAVVQRAGSVRGREQIDFRITGDPARLARLLTAGPLRRRLRIGVARVRGRRDGVAAVKALLALPLDLGALRRAGVSREPEVLFALVAAMIDPAWTRGESFTVSYADERGRAIYLQVRDGRPPIVSGAAPEGRVATVLAGSAEGAWRALSATGTEAPEGVPGGSTSAAGVLISGDRGPLELLRTWIARAQAG